MLVTNAGKIIRIRVNGGEGDSIRIAGRKTQGVRLFEIGKDETVMSVAIIKDADDDDDDTDTDADTIEADAADADTMTGAEPSDEAAQSDVASPDNEAAASQDGDTDSEA